MVDTLTTAQPSWAAMVGTSKSVSGVQNITRKHHSQGGGVDVRFRRKWRKCKIARAAHRHWVGGTPQALAQVLDPTNPRSASRGGRQIAVEDGENPARNRRFIRIRGLKTYFLKKVRNHRLTLAPHMAARTCVRAASRCGVSAISSLHPWCPIINS